MNSEKLTQKSQEALAHAQQIAAVHGHNEVDGEHLLLALLRQDGGVVPRLFEKMDVSVDAFDKYLARTLEARPSVRGPGVEAGKVFITQRLQRVIAAAEHAAKGLQDDYVSVEHLVLALLEEGRQTDAGKAFSEFNIGSERFLP